MNHRYALLFAPALFAAVIPGCDCAGDISTSGPCDLSDAPLACGQDCSEDDPCPAGLFCSEDGSCTAECGESAPCPNDGECDGEGRCQEELEDGGRTDARVRPRDAQGVDRTCASVVIDATRETPNVMLIVDRSGSMNEEFDDGVNRWDTLRNAVLGAGGDPGLVMPLQSSVLFGITMYDESSGGGCPDLTSVPCAFDNYTAIETPYRAANYRGGTPTGDSIQAILGDLDTLVPELDEHPTIFVLATDGEPDTCEDGDDEVNGRLESLAAIEAAFDMDIRTFVISVGDDVGEDHLQDAANAGVGNAPTDPDAPFWVANDTAGLVTALDTIIGSVVSCDLTLDGAIDPTQACEGTVTLGGDELDCGDDWEATDETHIRLLGTACDRLKEDNEVLTARFPCGIVVM